MVAHQWNPADPDDWQAWALAVLELAAARGYRSPMLDRLADAVGGAPQDHDQVRSAEGCTVTEASEVRAA